MGIFGWIILGGLAGVIANAIIKEEGGLIKNIVLGIVGGGVGGFIASLIGGEGINGFNIWSLVVATLGAILVIWVARAISNKK